MLTKTIKHLFSMIHTYSFLLSGSSTFQHTLASSAIKEKALAQITDDPGSNDKNLY